MVAHLRVLAGTGVLALLFTLLVASQAQIPAAVLPSSDINLIWGGENCTQNPNLCVGSTTDCPDPTGYATCTRAGSTNNCWQCVTVKSYTFCNKSDATHSCCVYDIGPNSPWCGGWWLGSYNPKMGFCSGGCPAQQTTTCGRQYQKTQGGPCP